MTTDSTVFIVDDQEGVRRALRRLIESTGRPVQTFSDAREFLATCDPSRPGCLVLDVRMPGMSGLELQEMLAQRDVSCPIVFITGHGDVPMSVRAMKRGAIDFLQKPFDEQTLLDAIQVALERDAATRRDAAARVDVSGRLASLTPRERQVFTLVVSGKPNKLIGQLLGASEKTIKVHRGRVMRKMQADSLAELVYLAQAAGIRPEPSSPSEPAAEAIPESQGSV